MDISKRRSFTFYPSTPHLLDAIFQTLARPHGSCPSICPQSNLPWTTIRPPPPVQVIHTAMHLCYLLFIPLLTPLCLAERMSASPRLDIPSRTSSANPAQPFDFNAHEQLVESRIQQPIIPTDGVDVPTQPLAAGPEALFSLESGFMPGFGSDLRARELLAGVASRMKRTFGGT